jgi:hypothetical protein
MLAVIYGVLHQTSQVMAQQIAQEQALEQLL